jgi:hypothetical protein
MSGENKAVVRRFNGLFGECWRTGNADILEEVLAPEFVLLTKGELMGIPRPAIRLGGGAAHQPHRRGQNRGTLGPRGQSGHDAAARRRPSARARRELASIHASAWKGFSGKLVYEISHKSVPE